MARENLDLTRGGILRNLIFFSLPVIATSLLQLFYNAADVAVVGKFAGAEALAAVSSSTPLVTVFTMLFIGISVGANVVIAQAKGEKDEEKVSRGVHTAIALGLISGMIVLVLGLIFARAMLVLMGSPEDVIDLSALYVSIVFIGSPAGMLFNFGASILRAMGDTKRPLYYLAVSGAVNVLLNLLLVIVFRMGVAGVAVATVTSQVLSAVFVIVHLMRAGDCTRLEVRRIRPDRELAKNIIRIGLPSGIQSSMFSISNAVIQSSVNVQGALVMAGNGAAISIENFVHSAMNAFHTAIITFASTNRGARRYDRVRRGPWVAMGIVTVLGLSSGLIVLYFGETLLGLYNSDPEVIKWGMERLSMLLPTYFICGLMEIISAQLRGLRYAIVPMAVSLIGVCGLRILWIYTVYAAYPTLPVLYISYPLTWGITMIAHLICYRFFVYPAIRREEQAWLTASAQ